MKFNDFAVHPDNLIEASKENKKVQVYTVLVKEYVEETLEKKNV